MANNRKKYLKLNAFMVKKEHLNQQIDQLIKDISQVNRYELDETHHLEGMLYVKKPTEKKPSWSGFTENISGESLDELTNQSSSAVLIIKTAEVIMAFAFGYGRHLIDTKYFVQDFGIKTALNTLNHDSLRSVDLFTLDDQAVQKKAQASRESGVSVFGIDISKDVLRAVTGSPRVGIDLHNISGGDSAFSFAVELEVSEIAQTANTIAGYYKNDSYKADFSWVDNIRKVKERSEVDILDTKLLDAIKAKSTEIVITLPEIIKWDEVYGFSFTRSKNQINPTIETKDYLDNIDTASISVELLKRDRLYIYDNHEVEVEHQLYKSIYFEYKNNTKTNILFAGVWYEIDNNFMKRINLILDQIKLSTLPFPKVNTWEIMGKKGVETKIETEGDYNERASLIHSYSLLDKKLIKSDRSTTSIELCDLMTDQKQFIHVKHRKGGSAGLSHLFAQGYVSAETLLGDRVFRKAARTVLRSVKKGLQDTVVLDNFKSDGVEVVYLILGEDSATLKSNLPFFSKVNLSKAYENLTQRGFTVTIAGADKEPI